MPFSPIFALPYENPQPSSDQPGITLHGGVPPTGLPADQQILALRVDDVLAGMTADDVSLDTRVTALETAMGLTRWRHIDTFTGTNTNDIVVPIPTGYKMLRVNMWGDGNDATARDVSIQVNGNTGNIHLWGLNITAANGTTDFSHSGAGTNGWRVGRWTTTENNNAVIHIFPSDGISNPSYVSVGARQSTGSAGHQSQLGYGKFISDTAVSSLTFIISTTTFAQVDGIVEGYLA